MLRVTKLTDYATLVMTVLAAAPDAVLSAAELAERAGIELPTAAKVLKPLAQAGLVDGFRGANTLALYSSSKWAVRGLTKTAALEFGPRGVRVNSVHPGGVDTAMGNPQGQTGEERNWAYGRVPLQRIGEPHEIAAASVFLCSDDASYIAGAELAVDGGWAAGYYHSYLPGAPAAIAGTN